LPVPEKILPRLPVGPHNRPATVSMPFDDDAVGR